MTAITASTTASTTASMEISLTLQQVLDNIARIIPALSLSSPDIALLIQSIQEHVKVAPPLHVPAIQKLPTT
jgi:hypothetical protein